MDAIDVIGLIVGIVDRPADFNEHRAQQISHIARMIERSNAYRPTSIDSPDVVGLPERNVPDPKESCSSIVACIDHPPRSNVKIRLNLFAPVEGLDAMVGLVASTVENLRSHRSME